ncbi:MAG: LPS export ABC transporter permease LptF [Pseudomonadota bacterium]
MHHTMLRILDRYIFRETAQTWVSVSGVLLLILLANQVARVLGDAAKDKVAKDAVFDVIGLTALQYLTIIIPFGLFLAIMLSLARLYSDSELPAMLACRIGPAGILRPLMWLAMPLAAVVAWLALVVAPESLRRIEVIGAQTERELDLTALEPGRFVTFDGGAGVIFASDVDAAGVLSDVFLQRREGELVEVVVARSGTQRQAESTDSRIIVLNDGRRYLGRPGERTFEVIAFGEYGVPFALPEPEALELEPEAQSLAMLMESSDRLARAELQWRLSIPISTLVLALLAVPLSRSQPRQGRYGKLAVGVLVFIIYFNLMGAAKVWVERDTVPREVGMWFVHVLMLGIGLTLLGTQYGWFKFLARRRIR